MSSALTFFAGQLDRLMLGKLVPLHLLGVYSIGYMLSRLPMLVVMSWTGNVFFPVASREFLEGSKGPSAVLRMRRQLNVVCALGLVVFFATASPLFHDPRRWRVPPLARMPNYLSFKAKLGGSHGFFRRFLLESVNGPRNANNDWHHVAERRSVSLRTLGRR